MSDGAQKNFITVIKTKIQARNLEKLLKNC